MNNIRLESDREYVKKSVNKLIDGFFDDVKKVNNELHEAKELITKLELSNTSFARGYATKLGILITKKQWQKICADKENQR